MRCSCGSRQRCTLALLLLAIVIAHPSDPRRSFGARVQRQSSRLRALRAVAGLSDSRDADLIAAASSMQASSDNTSDDLHISSGSGSAWLGGALRRVQSLITTLLALVSFLLRLPLRPLRLFWSAEAKPVEGGVLPAALSWAGERATQEEWETVCMLRGRARAAWRLGRWMLTASDVELLRFLRASENPEEAWKMVQTHAKWRTSDEGADSASTAKRFADSPLHQELFWLGLNKEGLPTLVVRTQAHDGKYYKENPKVYAAFLVSVLERGRRLYGVGVTKQMCILMDRGGLLVKDGEKKVEVLDMGVVPRLVDLVRHVVGTVKVRQTGRWADGQMDRQADTSIDPDSLSPFPMSLLSYLPTLLPPYSPTSLPSSLPPYSPTSLLSYIPTLLHPYSPTSLLTFLGALS
jgi:hypothetical protein